MKKTLGKITVVISIAILASLLLALSVSASGAEEAPLKEYMEERLLPVIAGVFTSIIALIGSLKGIFKVLSQLKSSKDSFDKSQKQIEENTKRELSILSKQYRELSEQVKSLEGLETTITEQQKSLKAVSLQCSNLAKISAIGFSQDDKLVKSGKSKEIALLAEAVLNDEAS